MLIAVCSDNNSHKSYITSLIQNYFEPNTLSTIYSYIPEVFLDYISRKGCPFHILLLDIEMEGYNAIDFAKDINQSNPSCQIIFTSINFQFYYKVYETEHIYFILKSQIKELLPKALAKAVKNLEKLQTDIISIKHKGKTVVLLQKEILYLESVGRHVLIHTKAATYECIRPLRDLNKELLDYFVRCHNSYIINLIHLQTFTRTEASLIYDIHIPISRTYYKNLKDKYLDYLSKFS